MYAALHFRTVKASSVTVFCVRYDQCLHETIKHETCKALDEVFCCDMSC